VIKASASGLADSNIEETVIFALTLFGLSSSLLKLWSVSGAGPVFSDPAWSR
jgi:hypothetical protein